MPKRKKILLSGRHPTIIDLARSCGKTAMIQACRDLIRVYKEMAYSESEIEELRKDLKLLIKTRIKRKRW